MARPVHPEPRVSSKLGRLASSHERKVGLGLVTLVVPGDMRPNRRSRTSHRSATPRKPRWTGAPRRSPCNRRDPGRSLCRGSAPTVLPAHGGRRALEGVGAARIGPPPQRLRRRLPGCGSHGCPQDRAAPWSAILACSRWARFRTLVLPTPCRGNLSLQSSSKGHDRRRQGREIAQAASWQTSPRGTIAWPGGRDQTT